MPASAHRAQERIAPKAAGGTVAAELVIAPRSCRAKACLYNADLCEERNRGERVFDKFRRFPGSSRDIDRLPANLLGFVKIPD